MRVVIKTHEGQIIIIDTDKIDFGWCENEMYAYFNGRSFPIELLTGVVE